MNTSIHTHTPSCVELSKIVQHQTNIVFKKKKWKKITKTKHIWHQSNKQNKFMHPETNTCVRVCVLCITTVISVYFLTGWENQSVSTCRAKSVCVFLFRCCSLSRLSPCPLIRSFVVTLLKCKITHIAAPVDYTQSHFYDQ